MKYSYKAILLILFPFICFAQNTQIFNSSITGSGQANGGSYTYSAAIKFQALNTGMGDIGVKLGISNFKITDFTYKNTNASKVEGVSLPISIPNVQSDFTGRLTFYKGTTTYTVSVSQLGVNSVEFNLGDLNSSDTKSIVNAFGLGDGNQEKLAAVNLKMANVDLKNDYFEKLSEVASKIDKTLSQQSSSSAENSSSNNNDNEDGGYAVSKSNDGFWSDSGSSTNNSSNQSSSTKSKTSTQTQQESSNEVSPQERQRLANEERARKQYEMQQERLRQREELQAKVAQYSQEAMSDIDQMASGDQLAAGIGKAAYTTALAAGGVFDANSAGQAIGGLINGFSANAKRKREEKARQEAIAAEERRIASEKQAFLDKLISNRRKAFNLLPDEQSTPNSATPAHIETSFYFAIYEAEGLFEENFPTLKVTDVFAINRYSDGSWPFKSTIPEKLEFYSKAPYTVNGYFKSYNEAYSLLSEFTEEMAKNGVSVIFLEASNDFDDPSAVRATIANEENDTDFWGNPTDNEKKEETKTIEATEAKTTNKEADFWGGTVDRTTTEKNVTEEDNVNKSKVEEVEESVVTEEEPVPTKEPQKKTDNGFWGKSIDLKKDNSEKNDSKENN